VRSNCDRLVSKPNSSSFIFFILKKCFTKIHKGNSQTHKIFLTLNFKS
jgi:hypothetical protein